MEEAKALFKKLKIVSLLDLALLIPSSYDDTHLSNEIKKGKWHVFYATVKESSTFNGRLRVIFHIVDLNVRLESIFFRATPYHYKLFEIGTSHYIQGRISEYRGKLQMNQPKSIKKFGKIIPKYSTPITEGEMRSLVEYYINEQALYKEGLEEREVSLLMKLHFPKTMDEVVEPDVEILKFIEAFNHIKKLREKKTDFPAIDSLNGGLTEFINLLPFELTKEQKIVIRDVQRDLRNLQKATKRLVIGDVGSGKTMIILAGAVIAYPKKSILMAPTSLLAMQIYEEAVKYLPKKMGIALVMQGRNRGDYKNADFIIGTHAILYKDDIPQAPLIMVDEQHRFGTQQRALLERMMAKGKKKPHFLQFSATPIPRTQAMMESELIDVSLITATPFKKDITTEVIDRYDFKRLLIKIEREIEKRHQVLIVYPLVEESKGIPYQSLDEGRDFWEKRFEHVYLTHGRDKNKEEVLLEFREKGNILLATTVVEVGISLPRLTVIVIVGAERLGLATLHQLRGRIGRLGLKSWCYLFSKDKKNPRLNSFKRTKSGFEIAKLDLKYRKSGDILYGTIQSGTQFKWLDLAEDEEIVRMAKKRVKSS